MNDYTDDEFREIFNDPKIIETFKDKPFYKCMGNEFTTERILSDIFGVKSMFEITEQYGDFHDVQDKFMEVVKPMLESGELFAQVLQKNGMSAVGYLIENFETNHHLTEQVIEQQTPYIEQYVSNQDWFDGESYEVDKELFSDFYKEYYKGNNSELERKVKNYFDKEFSRDWEITTKIIDTTEFKEEYGLIKRWCNHVSEIVNVQKKYGIHDQDVLDKWLQTKIAAKETAPKDPEETIKDYSKFCQMSELRDKLEQKHPPRQTKKKSMTMKI